jgi:hypothetical protein
MSGSIGVVVPSTPPKIGQKVGAGEGQNNLGSSEYHFNQVLDLVAPNGEATAQPSLVDLEMLDAEAMERVATVMGDGSKRGATWKLMAAAARSANRNSINPPTNLGQAAYKIYSGTTKSVDLSQQVGIDVVSSSLPASQH